MTFAFSRVAASLLIAGLFASLAGCRRGDNEYVPPPPPEVTVAHPVQRSITPFFEENGVIEAVEEAEIRARVRGFVEEIKFEPGQHVKVADVLYKIESDQYEAAVNSAEAAVAAADAAIGVAEALVKTAEAEQINAKQNLAREKRLLQRGAGSQTEVDAAVAAEATAAAALESAHANVKAADAEKGSAEASLANAQLDLDYTTVHAEISGRITKTHVKLGNLVDNGGLLTLVVDRSRVFVNFSVSDRQMLRFQKTKLAELKPGEELEEPDWGDTSVFLRRETDQGFPFAGKLEYIDQSGIDVATGTLGLRGEFENKGGILFPGLFVTVRVPTGEPADAMLIPEYAILRDPRGVFALIVNAENKVERVDVSISQTISGWSVIESGLTLESRVVIDGLQRARPGLEVTASDKPLEVDDQMLLRGLSPTGASSETVTAANESGTSEEE